MRDVHHAADLGCGLFAFEIPAYRLPVYFFGVAFSHATVLSLGTSVVYSLFKSGFKGKSVRKGANIFRSRLTRQPLYDTICSVQGKNSAPKRSLCPYEGAICK